MILSQVTASLFPKSAISRAEWLYQQRSAGRSRCWQRRLGRAVLLFGITMSMILFWGEVVGALLERDAGPIGERLQIATISFLGLTVIYHFVLMFRTLSLAANSISRERQNNTWDMLILTGIDAREIVRGKWAATVRRQWRSYAILGILLMGAATWYGASNGRYLFNILLVGSFYYRGQFTSTISDISLPTPLGIVFAGAAIFTLTMFNLLFTAACGVLASAQSQRGHLALVRAIALRIFIPLCFIIASFFIAAQLQDLVTYKHILYGIHEMVDRSYLTILDGGISVVGKLSSIHISYYTYPPDTMVYTVISVFLSISVYLLLTNYVLRIAQRHIMREQGLPPQRIRMFRRKAVV